MEGRAGAADHHVLLDGDQRVVRAGQPFDTWAMREEGLRCRAWLETELANPGGHTWDASVVITHFAPSLMSGDPRYGTMASTASFCNADDDLIVEADLWLHGHLHCRHDYAVARPGGGSCRVVCHARRLQAKGETAGWEPSRTLEV